MAVWQMLSVVVPACTCVVCWRLADQFTARPACTLSPTVLIPVASRLKGKVACSVLDEVKSVKRLQWRVPFAALQEIV